MKKTLLILSSAIIIVWGVIFLLINNKENSKKEENKDKGINLKIGSILVRSYDNKKDPFDVPLKDTVLILDIKDGYVKWTRDKWIKNSDTSFLSSEIDIFSQSIIKQLK